MDVSLETGEAARASSFDGGLLVLSSPRAFAPGAPVRFAAVLEGVGRRFEGRSLGSTRRNDAGFEVRVRLVNLTRGNRIALTAALAT